VHRCEHKTLKDSGEAYAGELVLLELCKFDCTQYGSGEMRMIFLKEYILLKLHLKDIRRTYQ